jgi:hypothetical protein
MESITIGSSTFAVYANVAAADAYAAGAAHADAWRALTDADAKGRYLVTATRVLDRQSWLEAYNTQALRFAEENIISGCIELALALADGSEAQNATTTQTIKSLKAGPTTIEYFRGAELELRFPLIVQELIGRYLAGADVSIGGFSSGTDACSQSDIDLGFDGGL